MEETNVCASFDKNFTEDSNDCMIVSSPIPWKDVPAIQSPEIEIIEISDDDEPSSAEMDDYFAEDNEVIMIKVMWKLKYQHIPLRRHQQFKDLCEVLAKHSDQPANTIVLIMDERMVHHTDTPDTIKYSIAKFIYARGMGRVVKMQHVFRDTRIALTVQSAGWQRPLVLHIQPTQKMKVLVILCAEQLMCKPSRLHFQFEGEPLDLEATAKDLELEDGEVFYMRFV